MKLLSEKLRAEVLDISEWPDEPRIKHQHEDWANEAAALEAQALEASRALKILNAWRNWWQDDGVDHGALRDALLKADVP